MDCPEFKEFKDTLRYIAYGHRGHDYGGHMLIAGIFLNVSLCYVLRQGITKSRVHQFAIDLEVKKLQGSTSLCYQHTDYKDTLPCQIFIWVLGMMSSPHSW